MKYLTLAAVTIVAATAATVAPAAEKTKLSPFQNDKQKLSYTLGYKSGLTLKQQSDQVDDTYFIKGLKAAFNGGKPLLDTKEMNSVIMDFKKQLVMQQLKKMKVVGDKNLVEADAFLKKNAKQKGIIQINPNLQYKIVKMGNGPMPKPTDMVTVNYEGKLLDGKVFDSSYKRGQPVSFELDKVIPGWTKALSKVPAGSTVLLYIHPQEGYGPQGSPPIIPPNSLLEFKVDLIKVGDDKKDKK